MDRSFLPLCMRARVHKLYVLIRAFMHPSLITKLFSSYLFLFFLGFKILNTPLHRSDRKKRKCLTPYLASRQSRLTGNET